MLHILLADRRNDEIDDIVQVLIVGIAPITHRRAGRYDDELVLVLDVERGKIIPLPVGVRAVSMQAQYDIHLVARLVVGGAIKKKSAAGLQLDRIAGLGHHRARAVRVGTMVRRRCGAIDAEQGMRLLRHRGSGGENAQADQDAAQMPGRLQLFHSAAPYRLFCSIIVNIIKLYYCHCADFGQLLPVDRPDYPQQDDGHQRRAEHHDDQAEANF